MVSAMTECHNDPKQSVLGKLFSIDLRSLAAFRMGVGFMLLVDLLYRWRHIEFVFTDNGLFNQKTLVDAFGNSIPFTSLHYHTGTNIGLQSFMFGIAAVAAISLLAGYYTWLATFVSWVLFISLNRRIPASCYGFDDVMRLLLVWSLFLPLGARWSLDALQPGRKKRTDSKILSVASAGLLLQVCYVYWFAALWKWHPHWYHGEALQYALQIDYSIRPLGQWLGKQTYLLTPLTYATLVVEFFFPFLCFVPWKQDVFRWIAIFAFVGLHVGIAVFMSIGLFPPISIVYWLLFVPESFWNRFFPKSVGSNLERDSDTPRRDLYRSKLASAIAVFMLLLITVHNVVGLPHVKAMGIGLPNQVELLINLMRLDQRWRLYAPTPKIEDGWYSMVAILDDGSQMDVWQNRAPTLEKPKLVSTMYPDYRVKMALVRAQRKPMSPLWEGTVRYYVRKWNENHPPEKHVAKLVVNFIVELEHDGPVSVRSLVAYDVATDQVFPQARASTK